MIQLGLEISENFIRMLEDKCIASSLLIDTLCIHMVFVNLYAKFQKTCIRHVMADDLSLHPTF